MRIYKYILGLSALSIAGCAAFFSVSGIGQLFVGSFLAVVIMAGSLEVGKLVAASYLHRYWSKSSYFLRGYLILGVIVLMLITSMGIFGFLTSAYQETASELKAEKRKIETLRERKQFLEKEIESYQKQRRQLSSIRSKQTSRLNSITTNDSLNADEVGYLTRQVQNRIKEVNTRLDSVRKDLNTAKDSISSIESRILELKSESEARRELGPLLYVAREFNTDPDTAVKWFTLAIIFVFDPLAVSLVLAYNNIVYYEGKNGNDNNVESSNGSGEDDGSGGNVTSNSDNPSSRSKDITQKLPLNKKNYSEKNVKDKNPSDEIQEIDAENIEEEKDERETLNFSVDVGEENSQNEDEEESVTNENQQGEEKSDPENNEKKDLSELREEFFEKSDSESENSKEGLTIDDLMETEEDRRDEDDDIEEILEELDRIDEEENVYGENPEEVDKQNDDSSSEDEIKDDSSNNSNDSKSTKRVDFHSGQKDVKRQ